MVTLEQAEADGLIEVDGGKRIFTLEAMDFPAEDMENFQRLSAVERQEYRLNYTKKRLKRLEEYLQNPNIGTTSKDHLPFQFNMYMYNHEGDLTSDGHRQRDTPFLTKPMLAVISEFFATEACQASNIKELVWIDNEEDFDQAMVEFAQVTTRHRLFPSLRFAQVNAPFLRALTCPARTKLGLSEVKFSSDSLRALCDMIPGLRKLSLWTVSFDDPDDFVAESMGLAIRAATFLVSLQLKFIQLNPTSIAHIVNELKGHAFLRSLKIEMPAYPHRNEWLRCLKEVLCHPACQISKLELYAN